MKQFILKSLFFTLISFVFLTFWNWRIADNINDHEELKYEQLYSGNEANGFKSYNSIIMGTSHFLNSLNPKYLDNDKYQFYNYSFPGANPKFFYNWFNEIYLDRNPVPKVIIFELHWLLFDKNKLYRKLEHDSEFLSYSDYFELLGDKKYDFKLALKNRIALVKYNDFSNFKNLIFEKTDYTPFPIELINDGFVPCVLSEEHKQKHFGENKLQYTVDDELKEYFFKLINLFESKNIKLIFLTVPEYGRDKNDYNDLEILKYLNEYSVNKNIPFINFLNEYYNAEYQDKRLFSDWDHTNEIGAEKFSNEFRPILDSVLNIISN